MKTNKIEVQKVEIDYEKFTKILNNSNFLHIVALNLLKQIAEGLQNGLENKFELSKEFVFTLNFITNAVNNTFENSSINNK